MTTKKLEQLSKKYTKQEINTAAKVLADVLAMDEELETEVFTKAQLKRLKTQLKAHETGSQDYLSLKQVRDGLGL